MNKNLTVAVVLVAVATIGGQYWQGTHSTPASQSTRQDAQHNAQLIEEPSEVEFTEQQQQAITAHNEKMQSLTNVEPVPVAQIPNINQSIKLPELKSLTANELSAPQLRLNGREAIGGEGNAHAVSGSNQSTQVSNTTTPVIDTVSRQTGIPAKDIEAAFNQ